MVRRHISCILALFTGLAFYSTDAHAQSYEAELKAVAVALMASIDRTGRHNGAVLDFTDLQGASSELGRFLAQEFSLQLVIASKDGKLSLIDRANLQALLKENKLSTEGLVDPESRRKLGGLIGIDTIISGTLAAVGNKNRLIVRAVMIETGEIIAIQAATLSAITGLGKTDGEVRLNNSAAPNNRPLERTYPGSTSSATEVLPSSNGKDELRNGAIKMIGTGVMVGGGRDYGRVALTATLENTSPFGFGAAVRQGSSSIGTCISQSNEQVSGLNVARSKSSLGYFGVALPEKEAVRYIPPRGKLTIVISFSGCDASNFTGLKTVDAAFALTVEINNEIFDIPLSTSGVPVRLVQ